MLYICLMFFYINILYASEHDLSQITIEMTTPIPDNSMDTPLRDLCDDMIYYYFKGNGTKIRDQIKPYLERKLNSSWKRQKISRMQGLELKRSSVKIDPDIERFITKRVSQAMEEAFMEEHEVRMRFQNEADSKVTKNQVAVITAVTGVVTAAITAGVTIAIAFGT